MGGLVKLGTSVGSGELSTALENPRERTVKIILTPKIVLITAAGLQGEQPLVDRTM